MIIELSACPHCGGVAFLSAYSTSAHKLAAYVSCEECGAHGATYDSIEQAVEAWNARVYSTSEIDSILDMYGPGKGDSDGAAC